MIFFLLNNEAIYLLFFLFQMINLPLISYQLITKCGTFSLWNIYIYRGLDPLLARPSRLPYEPPTPVASVLKGSLTFHPLSWRGATSTMQARGLDDSIFQPSRAPLDSLLATQQGVLHFQSSCLKSLPQLRTPWMLPLDLSQAVTFLTDLLPTSPQGGFQLAFQRPKVRWSNAHP